MSWPNTRPPTTHINCQPVLQELAAKTHGVLARNQPGIRRALASIENYIADEHLDKYKVRKECEVWEYLGS
jgi:hypothetical protein